MTTPTPNIPENIDESMKEAYNALLNMSSYNDFTNIDATANFILQCYKSRLLFDFLDSQDNLRRIKEMYLKEMGCKCWEEYIFVLAKLFIIDYQNKSSTTLIVLDENHPSFHHDKRILDQFALSSSDKISYDENVDFISFRDKPLIQFEKKYILDY